jgi:lipopolysaccharide cholinephosphotransferase
MAGTKPLVGINLTKSLEMLQDITTLFDQHNIQYALDGGTALGIIRENRLLPWDTDMDIAVDEKSVESIITLLKSLPLLKYRVRVRKLIEDAGPVKKGSVRLIKVWTRKYFFFKGDQLLDIFVRFHKDDQVLWILGDKQVAINSMPKKFHTQVKKIHFNQTDYWIPEEEDAFLTYRYGNWRVPVKEWDAFKNDGALIKDNA